MGDDQGRGHLSPHRPHVRVQDAAHRRDGQAVRPLLPGPRGRHRLARLGKERTGAGTDHTEYRNTAVQVVLVKKGERPLMSWRRPGRRTSADRRRRRGGARTPHPTPPVIATGLTTRPAQHLPDPLLADRPSVPSCWAKSETRSSSSIQRASASSAARAGSGQPAAYVAGRRLVGLLTSRILHASSASRFGFSAAFSAGTTPPAGSAPGAAGAAAASPPRTRRGRARATWSRTSCRVLSSARLLDARISPSTVRAAVSAATTCPTTR